MLPVVGLALADGADGLEAVHLGHLHIHEHEVEVARRRAPRCASRPSGATTTEWPRRSSMRTATFWLTGWSSASRILSRVPAERMARSAGSARAALGFGRGPARRGQTFIRASKSSDCRTGLVRQAAISRERRCPRPRDARGGQEQHGDRGDRRLAADPPGQVEAVHPRASFRRPARRRTAGPRPRRHGGPPGPPGRRRRPTAGAPQLARISSRIRRLVALSSTIRIGSPSSRGGSGSARSA